MKKIPQFCSEILSFTSICQSKTLITFFFFSIRWVKYEEDVEEGGERWSKPHVASLSLHSLFELRSSLLSGAVMLDMDAHNMAQAIGTDLFLLFDSYIGRDHPSPPFHLRQYFPKFHYKFGAVEQKFIKLSCSNILSVTTVTFYGISLS